MKATINIIFRAILIILIAIPYLAWQLIKWPILFIDWILPSIDKKRPAEQYYLGHYFVQETTYGKYKSKPSILPRIKRMYYQHKYFNQRNPHLFNN